jgi:hypothetical protein
MFILLALACGTPTAPPAEAPATEPVVAPAPAEVTNRVFFEQPKDGATVSSPVKVVFGAEGLEVEKAGQVRENSGHHHIIVNGGPIAEGTAVPKDETHIHFGGGQTETELELEPGEYTLTMQFADGSHMSFGEPLSSQVKITVE